MATTTSTIAEAIADHVRGEITGKTFGHAKVLSVAASEAYSDDAAFGAVVEIDVRLSQPTGPTWRLADIRELRDTITKAVAVILSRTSENVSTFVRFRPQR
jgi:hypothetical protein